MNDIILCFEKTLNYLEDVILNGKFEKNFYDKLNVQKENLEDLKEIVNQYEKDVLTFGTCKLSKVMKL